MQSLGERDDRSGLVDCLRGAPGVSLTLLPATHVGVVACIASLSRFLGFFPGCKGLAPSGGAGVGQVQRLPPFSTLFASVPLLSEQVDATTVAAIAVRVVVGIGRRMPIARSAT